MKTVKQIFSIALVAVMTFGLTLNSEAKGADDTSSSTVVEIAVSNPDFSILVEAVTKADLAGALSADGPVYGICTNKRCF